MRILLVDLWNVFHVMWHAGTNQYARWPFDNTMGRCRQLAKEYDACAFMADGGKSLRAELDPRWKANRDEKAAGLFAQLSEVERQLDVEGFHLFKVPSLEADDLIASAVHQLKTTMPLWGKPEFADVITIHSSDRDLFGLLEPGVQLLTTVEPQRIIVADQLRASKKIGVDAPKMRDFLVLSDRHNGVKYFDGIGPVNAAALLNEHGDLATILSKIDNHVPDSEQYEIHPPSVRASIKKALAETIEGRPLIDVAMQIVTLRTDAPIDIKTIFKKKEPKTSAESEWDDAGSEDGSGVQVAVGGIMRDEPGDCGRAGPVARGVENGAGGNAAMVAGDVPSRTSQAVASGGMNGTNASSDGRGQASSVGPVAVGERPAVVVQRDAGESKASGARPPREEAPPSAATSLIVAPRWELALEPTTPSNAWRLAQTADRAGFWTKHGGPDGCLMIILAGRSRGLTAFDALNGMHVIDGKPVFGAYLLIGMVQAHPSVDYFELAENDEQHALWIAKRKKSKREQKRLYTIEQAMKAGLVRETYNGKPSNWIKNPEDMLIKTAGAKLTRGPFAYITSGAVAAEEMGYE